MALFPLFLLFSRNKYQNKMKYGIKVFLITFEKVLFLNYVCLYVGMYVRVHMPSEARGITNSGAGVPGEYEPPDRGWELN